MRILMVFAIAMLIAVAAKSSPVSAHHLKTPEELCVYTTRRDCLTAMRILYEYCHKPERVNEEECIKWPTLDNGNSVPAPISTPTAIPPTPVVETAVPSSEPTSSQAETMVQPSSAPSKVSLDPAVSKTPQAKKEMSTQTTHTGTESPAPTPTSTLVAEVTNPADSPSETLENKAVEKTELLSSRLGIGLVIGLVVLLIAITINKAKQSK